MHAILAEFGLPYVYPKNVETAAEKIPAEISEADYAEREDFRNVTTFTIDPKDAKDFDDALSIRPIKPGLWEVGVHIADVTHYVKEGSVIDKEAEKRATSVYLVDRTIPMLPGGLICGPPSRRIEPVRVLPSQKRTHRSITLRSSRTLPFQSWRFICSIKAGSIEVIFLLNFRLKYSK